MSSARSLPSSRCLAALTAGVAAMLPVAPVGLVAFAPPAHAVQASVITTPRAPAFTNVPGTENDTFTVFSSPGVDWFVNGVLLDAASLDRPQSLDGRWSLVIEAKPQPGYTFPAGAQTTWTMIVDPPPPPPPQTSISHTIDATAPVPTSRVSWSADGATTYDVTYHKILLDGSAGPELAWLMDTTATTATFVAEPGDEYVITVTAKNDHGMAEPVSTTVAFHCGGCDVSDVSAGVGRYSAGWQFLGNLGLPYVGNTAVLGFSNARWDVTVPPGTQRFDLLATVHSLGARGKILVNGRSWADFETNASYWGTVANPYGYPVRRIQGWDFTRPATITVIVTDGGTKYLALDAFRVLN